MGDAIGIIGTLFVILYFSRKQTQSLSVDIETRVINYLAERMHALYQIVKERPQLMKVISRADANSPKVAYAYDILFTFTPVFYMRKRKVLSDNEWTGWLRWMKSAFDQGKLCIYGKALLKWKNGLILYSSNLSTILCSDSNGNLYTLTTIICYLIA